jgi:hypothetical protein
MLIISIYVLFMLSVLLLCWFVFLLNAFLPNVISPKMVQVSESLLYILLSVCMLDFLELCTMMLSLFIVMLVVFLLNAFLPSVMAPNMVQVREFLL